MNDTITSPPAGRPHNRVIANLTRLGRQWRDLATAWRDSEADHRAEGRPVLANYAAGKAVECDEMAEAAFAERQCLLMRRIEDGGAEAAS